MLKRIKYILTRDISNEKWFRYAKPVAISVWSTGMIIASIITIYFVLINNSLVANSMPGPLAYTIYRWDYIVGVMMILSIAIVFHFSLILGLTRKDRYIGLKKLTVLIFGIVVVLLILFLFVSICYELVVCIL